MLDSILKLQLGVKLLRGDTTKRVPQSDIVESPEAFKEFNLELIEMGIPIRYMTHGTIHIPSDVDYFGVGMERLSAWMDETFKGKMRQAVHSGSKPAEQIRNRLVQRYLYLLPTRNDGTILDSKSLFELEVKKATQKGSKERIVLNYKVGRGSNPKKTVVFPNFTVTTTFPDNVLLMANESVVLCLNLVVDPDTNVMTMICAKFTAIDNPFPFPYHASRFQQYIVSNLSPRVDVYNVNQIKAKMLACPYLLENYVMLPDIFECSSKNRWFVTALQHTVT